ncbi:uncharacterized protein LOC129188429 isoform X4 [Dunckerocampus dactyliophorus]|uniref:uncharacterized protein LOC129188429 isoform X4 n=1 Tax=Dunckerocampus dactyliophorus TaxID=161453 RepID=UPI00240583B2|nr:uncharacterized protein LOC129188429 isoform X4 [Dunckerocampus dactyliophorus]
MDLENRIATLNDVCCRAVSKHWDILGTTAVLNLPRELLKDLLLHLNVCQLDELQTDLNLKGISTFSEWYTFYRRLRGRARLKTFDTVEDVKKEVMGKMFEIAMNGQGLPQSVGKHLNTPTLLMAAAKTINHFKLSSGLGSGIDLAALETPVLGVLEQTVTTLSVWIDKRLPVQMKKSQMYIIHRLIQHGVTKHVILRTDDHDLLYKVLFEGGCLNKLQRKVARNTEGSSQTVPKCSGCPNKVIEHLELEECSSKVLKKLIEILPWCSHLTALTVRHTSPIAVSDMLDFTKALEQLFQSSDTSLSRLSIEPMLCASLLRFLLHAYPRLTELNVEFGNHAMEELPPPNDTNELPLEHLSVKLNQLLTSPDLLLSVLRRCPHLVTLRVGGVYLPAPFSQTELLTTLSESNGCLTSLHLMDLNLSDCFHQMLTVLRVCKLEELHLHDCRLLEQQSDKQEALQLLVDALKAAPSLRKLTLTQNRLARDVHVLAELFTGPTPSSVEYLDLRHNLILPSDIVRFAEVLTTHPPPQRLTLDLTYNLGDGYEWNAAVDKLRPFCQRVANDWEFSNLMSSLIY